MLLRYFAWHAHADSMWQVGPRTGAQQTLHAWHALTYSLSPLASCASMPGRKWHREGTDHCTPSRPTAGFQTLQIRLAVLKCFDTTTLFFGKQNMSTVVAQPLQIVVLLLRLRCAEAEVCSPSRASPGGGR